MICVWLPKLDCSCMHHSHILVWQGMLMASNSFFHDLKRDATYTLKMETKPFVVVDEDLAPTRHV